MPETIEIQTKKLLEISMLFYVFLSFLYPDDTLSFADFARQFYIKFYIKIGLKIDFNKERAGVISPALLKYLLLFAVHLSHDSSVLFYQ